jgi:hypothetical protein
MARTGGAAADDWAFLMRPADGRELYGDAYIFDSKAGAPPARLASTLRELAEELGDDSGYVEFEANGATVAAYCDTDDVGIHQRIIQWLPRLSRF